MFAEIQEAERSNTVRNENRIPYEKAETAKSRLIELMDELVRNNAKVREIDQLDTIIANLEVWQNKYST